MGLVMQAWPELASFVSKKAMMGNAGRKSSEGSARTFMPWAVKNYTRAIVLDKLRGMHMRESCFPDVDVARHDMLRKRVKNVVTGGPGDPLVSTRGLVIVDANNNIMLIFLPAALPER